MLTDPERAAVAGLRAAGDILRKLPTDPEVVVALGHVDGAIMAVHARAGRRDADNRAQAEYLAEQAGTDFDVDKVPGNGGKGGRGGGDDRTPAAAP